MSCKHRRVFGCRKQMSTKIMGALGSALRVHRSEHLATNSWRCEKSTDADRGGRRDGRQTAPRIAIQSGWAAITCGNCPRRIDPASTAHKPACCTRATNCLSFAGLQQSISPGPDLSNVSTNTARHPSRTPWSSISRRAERERRACRHIRRRLNPPRWAISPRQPPNAAASRKTPRSLPGLA